MKVLKLPESNGMKRPLQPDIANCLNESARESFKKLTKTAYEMALTLSMPHKHFKVLVKCQRANGVRLVLGKDGGNAAREFIHCIADAIKKVCSCHCKQSFYVNFI